MTYTDKHIIETYSVLFEGLSPLTKVELIENLSKSLKTDNTIADGNFYKSFGAFSCQKTPEEIIADIKSSRKFREKEIKF